MKRNLSILIIPITIISIIFAPSLEVTLPSAFSQLLENEKSDQSFLLRARIIVNDPTTETVGVKLKSQNIAQEQSYDRSVDDNSQTRLKFKFNDVFNTQYEICATSNQDSNVYACKGGLLYTLKPNVTLTL